MKNIRAVLASAQAHHGIIVELSSGTLHSIDEEMTMALYIEERCPGLVPEPAVVAETGLIKTNVELPLGQEAAAAGLWCCVHEAPLNPSIFMIQPSAQSGRRSRNFPFRRRPFSIFGRKQGLPTLPLEGERDDDSRAC